MSDVKKLLRLVLRKKLLQIMWQTKVNQHKFYQQFKTHWRLILSGSKEFSHSTSKNIVLHLLLNLILIESEEL